MRTLPDRIRHTLMFEIIALTILALVGNKLTGHSIEEIGVLGLIMSMLAMTWNFIFNWGFDKLDLKYRDARPRGWKIRVVHAVSFEVGLMSVGIFVIAAWLNVSLWYAFVLDIGIAVFFLAYAFTFNWIYDLVFPVKRPQLDTV